MSSGVTVPKAVKPAAPQAPPFAFRRVRDYSECISDGFQFIRLHWRGLYRPLLFVCVPLKVVAAVLLGAFFRSMAPGSGPGTRNLLSMFLGYALMATAYFLASVLVCEYMRAVMTGDGTRPGLPQLWREVRRQLPAYFAVGLVTMLIAGTSVFLFVVPFIFMLVVFQFSYPLRAFERASVGDCIGRAFSLVWGRWWATAALFFTLVVLSIVLNTAVDVPAMLLSGFGSLSGADWMNDPEGASTRYGLFFSLVTLISSVTYLLLMPFLQVPMGLHMLSVLEKKESPGLLNEVQRFSLEADH